MNLKDAVLIAEKQIRCYIHETPLDFSVELSEITGIKVYLKCENTQYTGSFKVRGAFNKLLSLSSVQKKLGVVTASTGNHGTAVAFGLKKLNIPGIIFVPENASLAKVKNIRNHDVPLKFYATDCLETETYAREYAKKHNMLYISPYNDVQVISGQGTIAVEMIRQLNTIDDILVPIGGGGLIAGIAGYIKSVSPETQIIGCLPQNSPVMFESIKAGKIVDIITTATLSDATAGGIEARSITFDLCKDFVDDYILVSEQEIKDAMNILIKTQRILVEGASAVSLASLLKNIERFRDRHVVILLSGGNISVDTLNAVLS